VYQLAPEDPIGVSSAAACTATLTTDKRRAVKSYLNTLGPALQQKYGRHRHYTPAQVRETVLEQGLRTDYLCWAFALHCPPVDFERIHAAAGELCDYTAMREVVGAAFFGGNAAFDATEVTAAILSGAAEAATAGAVGLLGWMAEVDWPGLMDWS
jgi:hypothetical protein